MQHLEQKITIHMWSAGILKYDQQSFPDSLTIEESDFTLLGEYGPVEYKGIC